MRPQASVRIRARLQSVRISTRFGARVRAQAAAGVRSFGERVRAPSGVKVRIQA